MTIIKIKPEDAGRFREMIDSNLEEIYCLRREKTKTLINDIRKKVTVKINYRFPLYFERVTRLESDDEVLKRVENELEKYYSKQRLYSISYTYIRIKNNCCSYLSEEESSLKNLKKQLELGVDVYYDCSEHDIVFENVNPEPPPFKNHDA